MNGRYDAAGPESEFQPGSRGRVLRNRRGITSVRQLERDESAALLAATQRAIDETRVDQRFAARDIRVMHQRWLHELYEWAGEYPFRAGNGRCARLLAMLMGLQAGLPALDFGWIRAARKREYIAAVHAALDRDYDPMTKIFHGVIERTLRRASKTSSE